MREAILTIRIQNEMDIVLAYRRAKQLSELTGLNISTQTKFATAISEICRNVMEHVGEGEIAFNLIEETTLYLEAVVKDHGRGIDNLDQILKKQISNGSIKGCGIINSKKLVDLFDIESNALKGTKVTLRKKIPVPHPPINNLIIEGWKNYFLKEVAVSPYEEIKKQNMYLI
jgi:anti-sigma regulatory factor (Ser/Thr protein kinase)